MAFSQPRKPYGSPSSTAAGAAVVAGARRLAAAGAAACGVYETGESARSPWLLRRLRGHLILRIYSGLVSLRCCRCLINLRRIGRPHSTEQTPPIVVGWRG